MAYVALYRKWRPTGFDSLVGQEQVSRTLAQAIRTGRVGHAYLFSGPRGTGKTSTAKILAKALNCDRGPTPEPCNECESCRRINDGTSMDVLEIDAASNRGIDEIRGLRETVKFAPAAGRWKVYIIDEVHMLTTEAFNALLKTLEEPPAQVVFILATTEIHKVPATIQSRCQRYDFKRIAARDIEARLRHVCDASGIVAEDLALALIAREAAGGMRDALSSLDQCAALAEGGVTEALVRNVLGLIGREGMEKLFTAIAGRDAGAALAQAAAILDEGKDIRRLVAELIAELRAVMVYQAAGPLPDAPFDVPADALAREAALVTPEAIPSMIARLHEVLTELRWTTEPRIALETALLTLCRAPMREAAPTASAAGSPVAADESRLKALEARVAQLSAELAARPVATAAPAPAPTEPAPPPAPAGHAASPASPLPKTPAKPRRTTVRKAAAADVADAAVTPEGTAIWQKLLDELQQDEEYHIFHKFLSKAHFGGMTDKVFRVLFDSEFIQGRVERDDSRQAIEERLARLAGSPRRLICETTATASTLPRRKKAAASEPPPAPASEEPPVKPLPLSAEGKREEAILTGLFGGHLEPVPEESAAAPENKTPPTPAPATAAPAKPPGPDDAPFPGDDDFPDDGGIPFPDDDDAPPPEEE